MFSILKLLLFLTVFGLHESGTRKAIFWSETIYNKNLINILSVKKLFIWTRYKTDQECRQRLTFLHLIKARKINYIIFENIHIPVSYGILNPMVNWTRGRFTSMVYWTPLLKTIHGISTPLPMVYWTPYPWYIDPPIHGILPPLSYP
jgi:hypothetical protein